MVDAYCMKCKKKVDVVNAREEVKETKKGNKLFLMGQCSVCNTNVCKVLGKPKEEEKEESSTDDSSLSDEELEILNNHDQTNSEALIKGEENHPVDSSSPIYNPYNTFSSVERLDSISINEEEVGIFEMIITQNSNVFVITYFEKEVERLFFSNVDKASKKWNNIKKKLKGGSNVFTFNK